MDYRSMPLRKPIALWSLVLAGSLTILLTLVWIVTNRVPPGEITSIVIALITVPPTAYMGTSVYQSVRTQTESQEPLSQCPREEERG